MNIIIENSQSVMNTSFAKQSQKSWLSSFHGLKTRNSKKNIFTIYKVKRKVKESSQGLKHWALTALRS